ncbi:MAG TPA: glutamate formimidoyltransferase [Firmicutes bacterium]|nr:glutamate formimidoyltransferase [Bacillota bacterium]
MNKIVECVPNFSEGRRKEVVDAIVDAITAGGNVRLIDREMDADHNRSVVTFVGEPEECVNAAFAGVKRAAELIDLNKHTGEHPRIGATDVVPFIPVKNISMEECVELANKLGKKIADELSIPVYLYEEAATKPSRKNLANIRKGQFEGLKKAIEEDPERKPDFGYAKIHPTAGATVVGARYYLIAFNVNLRTDDLSIAKKIAKSIRFKNGGFRFIKAMGFAIKERGIVQVSMNMTNYQKTSLFHAFEFIKREAERYGVLIAGSELVGLTPMEAIIDVADYYLRFENPIKEQILENKIWEDEGILPKGYLSSLSSDSPAPGGGSVAALDAAQAAALAEMVARLTVGKKKYAEFENEMKDIIKKSSELRQLFTDRIRKDIDAFNEVMKAYKMPKETDEEKAIRKEAIKEATIKAIDSPMEIIENSIPVFEILYKLAIHGNTNAISDVGVASLNMQTAFKSAAYNVYINFIPSLSEDYIEEKKEKIISVKTKIEEYAEKIEKKVSEKIGI